VKPPPDGDLHVVHTVASLAPELGGPSRTVPALCGALREAGVDTTLVTFQGHERDVTEAQALALRHVALERRGLARLGTRRALRRLLHERGTRLVHDHGIWLPTNHAATRAANDLRLSVVVSPRGMLEPWSLRHRAWKKRVAWRLYQHADLRRAAVLHATSAMEADNFRALGFRQPIAIIPNGVWFDELAPSESSPRSKVALFI
jgi:glycosyltransferase involved in cell wall biosynthesis